MLNALKSLWEMIVKALTLGAMKGNSYMDSKVSPLEKTDATIKKLKKSVQDKRHDFFKLAESLDTSRKTLTKEMHELGGIDTEIKALLADGREDRAKQKARLAVQKKRLIETLSQSVENMEKRKDDLACSVEKIKTDIQIFESMRSELQVKSSLRDDSKRQVTGYTNSDGIEQTVDELIKETESYIERVDSEDTAWQETREAFKPDTLTAPTNEVDDYLTQFKS